MKKRLLALFAAAAMIFTLAGAAYASDEAPAASDEASAQTDEFAGTLFDTGYIHEINITISEEDWDTVLDNAMGKPKVWVTAEIDGEVYEDVHFSPKGNGSLALVAADPVSDRYSFKLNFSASDESRTYHGIGQFVLNNSYDDDSYLRDYACAWLFRQMGIPTARMSFTELYINGEFYGVYMAEESPYDTFVQREMDDDGVLYKPVSEVLEERDEGLFLQLEQALYEGNSAELLESLDEIMTPLDPAYVTPGADLKYTHDTADSYTDIFENDVFGYDDDDEAALIAALKNLSEGNVEQAIDTDEVIRYFAVHNFVGSSDGYTNVMLHNYLLYESEDGILSMLPWDYNNAMEPYHWAVTGGTDLHSWTELINMGLDSPTYSEVAVEDRPMLSWIFENEEYYAEYVERMQEVMALVTSGAFEAEMQRMYEQIRPYVYEDPTAFCTPEEFEASYQDLISFCTLRAESLQKQLDGELATVTADQDPDARIHYKD